MSSSKHMYFAWEEADKLIAHVEQSMNYWGANSASSSIFTGVLGAYWRNIAAYYSCLIGADSWLTSLGYTGEQGELVGMKVPLARTLVRQFVSLITKQRQHFECVTDVTDANPLQTARLGKAICNNLVEKHHIDSKLEKVAERVCVTGQAFLSCIWKTDKGYIYDINPDETVQYSGDIAIEMHDFQEVVYDWSCESWDQLNWILVKRVMNRWDLVAQYPELEDKIAGLPSVKEARQALPNFNFMSRYDDMDTIYCYEFYHKPTPALPHGRMTVWGGADCVFFDSPDYNPYECIPVVPFQFETVQGTMLGYPMLSSLLPAQEMFDHSMSVTATNQSAFGVQSVLVPKGADIDVQDVSQGMNFITYTPQNAEGGGKPEPLQLTATPPEISNFAKMLEDYMGQISMINSTLRGQPPANVTSGAMAATLSANALEFLSTGSKAITFGIEQVMHMAIKNYQKFATIDQMVEIAGEDQFAYIQTFKGEALKSIKQVRVRNQSPMLATVAGRLQLADSLLQAGILTDPQKYVSLIEGAPVEILFESQLAENTAIQQEIDKLLSGENVIPAPWDNHPEFIKEYRKLLYNQTIRTNSQFMGKIMQLIEERMNLEMQMDPNIKALLRGQPMPQQAPAGGGGSPGQAVQSMNQQNAPAAPSAPAQAMA